MEKRQRDIISAKELSILESEVVSVKKEETLDVKIAAIEDGSLHIEEVINSIIKEYSDELDEYVKFVKSILDNDEHPATDTELEDITMTLSTLIYYTSVGCEMLGVRDDVAKMSYKEAYNIARDSIDKGTVADKNTQAELQARQERIVAIIYEKSYKILKAKTECANELLSSAKKVLSSRMSANELSRTQVYK